MTCHVCHRPVGDLRECPYCDEPVPRPKWERRLFSQVVALSLVGTCLLAVAWLAGPGPWGLRPSPLSAFPEVVRFAKAVLFGFLLGTLVLYKKSKSLSFTNLCGIVLVDVWALSGVAYLYPNIFHVVYTIVAKHGFWMFGALCLAFSVSARNPTPIPPVYTPWRLAYLHIRPRVDALLMSGFLMAILSLVAYGAFPTRLLYSAWVVVFLWLPSFFRIVLDIAIVTCRKRERLCLALAPVVFGLWACHSTNTLWEDPLPASLVFSATVTAVVAVAVAIRHAHAFVRRSRRTRPTFFSDDGVPWVMPRNIESGGKWVFPVAILILAVNGIPGFGLACLLTAWAHLATRHLKCYAVADA